MKRHAMKRHVPAHRRGLAAILLLIFCLATPAMAAAATGDSGPLTAVVEAAEAVLDWFTDSEHEQEAPEDSMAFEIEPNG